MNESTSAPKKKTNQQQLKALCQFILSNYNKKKIKKCISSGSGKIFTAKHCCLLLLSVFAH